MSGKFVNRLATHTHTQRHIVMREYACSILSCADSVFALKQNFVSLKDVTEYTAQHNAAGFVLAACEF